LAVPPRLREVERVGEKEEKRKQPESMIWKDRFLSSKSPLRGNSMGFTVKKMGKETVAFFRFPSPGPIRGGQF